MSRVAEAVIHRPWWVVLLFTLITGFFAMQLPNLEIDPEVKNQLPEDMAARVDMGHIEERFGGSEMLMVVLQAEDVLDQAVLKQAREVSDLVDAVPQVERVLDVFHLTQITGSDGMMLVEKVVEDIPQDADEKEALRAKLGSNPMIMGNVLARDLSAMAIIGVLKSGVEDGPAVASVREIVDGIEGPATMTLGGFPDIRTRVSEDIRGDMRTFVPLGLGIILVFLWACFRQVRGVLLPFAVVVMSTVVAMGLIPIFGWKVQMVTVVLPVILLAVANDYGIHLMAKYQEDNQPGAGFDGPMLARRAMRDLGAPVIAAAFTTMAGLLCLNTHIIVPAAQLGVLATIGVFFALAGSLCFIPAVLAILPVAKPILVTSESEEVGPLEKLLRRVATWVGMRPKACIVSVVVVSLAVSTGIPQISVDTNPINYYPEGAPVAETSALIDKHFGGSTELAIQVNGDIDDPAVLGRIDALQTMLRDRPEVGFTHSIVDVIKSMNQAAQGGAEDLYRLPDSRDAVAQYHLLYSMGGSPEDFEQMIDFEHEHALITARISSVGTQDIQRVVSTTEDFLLENPVGEASLVSGFGAVFVELVDAVVQGQIVSLALALFFVVLLVSFTFRSLAAGFYAVLPLILAIALLFGGMGWAGIELNVITAMLSSIMVGVGIDYTIHFLWRYRAERSHGLNPNDAVVRTLMTAGRGIVFNALSVVVGFAVLLLSNFLPVMFFGFLVVVSISACLIGALVLLPALVLVARPAFLEPKSAT